METTKKENKRLVRKSTVQSVGEISEDEDHESLVIENEEDFFAKKWET